MLLNHFFHLDWSESDGFIRVHEFLYKIVEHWSIIQINGVRNENLLSQ